jgi:hypothetical protein
MQAGAIAIGLAAPLVFSRNGGRVELACSHLQYSCVKPTFSV